MNLRTGDFEGDPPLTVEVQLLYEDFATGLRARLLLDWVRQRMGTGTRTNESLWRLDVLNERQLLKVAVEEALNAQIVVVSAHGGGGLPHPLKNWADEWLLHKSENAPLVVLCLDAQLSVQVANHSFVDAFQRLFPEGSSDILLCFLEPSVSGELTWHHKMIGGLRGSHGTPHDSQDGPQRLRASDTNEQC